MKAGRFCLLMIFMLVFAGAAFAADANKTAIEKPLRIVILSDINDAYGSTTYGSQVDLAMKFIDETRPDLVLLAGDLVAGQSLKLGAKQLQEMWRSFSARILQPLTVNKIPFAFTFGNHDGSGSPRFAHERAIAIDFWHKNRPQLEYVDATSFPLYYSFRFHDIFFAVIDASTSKIDKVQQRWLESQLAKETAQSASARVVMGHLPLYAVAEGRNKPGDILAGGDDLLAAWRKNGVDYYLSGHHHAFFAAEKDGLTMILSGALGGGPRRYIGSSLSPQRSFTLLEKFTGQKRFKINAYVVGKGIEKMQIEKLPARIDGCTGSLFRIEP